MSPFSRISPNKLTLLVDSNSLFPSLFRCKLSKHNVMFPRGRLKNLFLNLDSITIALWP